MHVALQNNFHSVTTEFWQCLQNWVKLLENALLEVGQCHILLDSGSPAEYPFMAFLSMGNRKMYGGSKILYNLLDDQRKTHGFLQGNWACESEFARSTVLKKIFCTTQYNNEWGHHCRFPNF